MRKDLKAARLMSKDALVPLLLSVETLLLVLFDILAGH